MDSRVEAVKLTPVYEDFEASTELVQEKDCDTLLLNLPDFRKEHLKVQLTTSKILRISGSRPIGNNKWRRFQKEFPVSPDHDTQNISAKFEGGILYLRIPKLQEKKEEKQDGKLPASVPATKPQNPEDQPPPHKSSVQERATEKPAQKDDSSKQANAQNVKEEPKDAKEKNPEPTDSSEKKAEESPEEKTSGLDDSKKKSIAGDERKDDTGKAVEKRGKDGTETVDGSGKTGIQNYKEAAGDLASKLKKHRRILNLTLVLIFALAFGLHVTNFIRSLKRSEN